VRAGKLNECQPDFGLLGPASAEAATLGESGNRPLHHPSPRDEATHESPFAAGIRRSIRWPLSGIDLDVGRVASS